MDLKALHALPSIKKRKDRKRVGRGPGSGMGKRSTRGQKGAGSRSGWHMRDFYEGGQTPLMRRIPKRGFTNNPFATTRFAVLNVADLNCFEDGVEIDPAVLVSTGLIKQAGDGVKILGDGDLERKLSVKAHRFSKSAVEKIKAKGGSVTVLRAPKPVKERPAAKAAAPAAKKEKKAGGDAQAGA